MGNLHSNQQSVCKKSLSIEKTGDFCSYVEYFSCDFLQKKKIQSVLELFCVMSSPNGKKYCVIDDFMKRKKTRQKELSDVQRDRRELVLTNHTVPFMGDQSMR